MRRHLACVLAGLAFGIGLLPDLVSEVQAQEAVPQPAVIDTIIIRRDNVFNEEEAAGAGAFRVMNKLHI
ncbi:MAG: hypothetical protein V3T20_09020, partial [Gemmatimonadota bacterium]